MHKLLWSFQSLATKRILTVTEQHGQSCKIHFGEIRQEANDIVQEKEWGGSHKAAQWGWSTARLIDGTWTDKWDISEEGKGVI